MKYCGRSGERTLFLLVALSVGACTSATKTIVCPAGQKINVVSTEEIFCQPCPTGFYKSSTSTYNSESSINVKDKCIKKTTCPSGKYDKAPNNVIAQVQCETCATGFYSQVKFKSNCHTSGPCEYTFGCGVDMREYTVDSRSCW